MDDSQLIAQRKEKLVKFAKEKFHWLAYILLAVIVFISVKIRTANLSGLRDITTGGWTLGPDLDPWLFHRWAQYIVENGSLMVHDAMRYVPLGFNTAGELILLPYLMAWFHRLASVFGSESFTQSAALFPVFMFAITVIAFFFFAREIFVSGLGRKKATTIALISSFFLAVFPTLLPRTIAGIPEKESAAFFFMFLTFYLFMKSWKSEKDVMRYALAIGAGLSTAAMAMIWGGHIYVFVTLGLAGLLSLLFFSVERKHFYTYAAWIASAFIVMMPLSTRYSLGKLLNSTTTGFATAVLLLLGTYILITETKLNKYFRGERLSKVPMPLNAIIVGAIIGIVLASVLFGPAFIFSKIVGIKNDLVTPTADRLGVTVAENRQPYFTEWVGNFGPVLAGIPITFWLFFIGSVWYFVFIIRRFNRKEKLALSAAYFVFLIAIVFSRYKTNHLFNGENAMSLLLYFGGIILFFAVFGYYYNLRHKSGRIEEFKKIRIEYLILFALFLFGLISARSSVRTIMMLAPSAAILISFFVVDVFSRARKVESKDNKIWAIATAGVIIFLVAFSAFHLYSVSNASAKGFVPGTYNQQWQLAMSWVRENTPENAVFAHWWDYGYWVQSIGERATILDGGNAVGYWNHFMGRHVLTGTSNENAIEFLYAHNATHLLIDSTDIGKYPAFSSIGSDENYDRRSWISTLIRDDSQSFETNNSTVVVYVGGSVLDEDIVYEQDGKTIFLPEGRAGLAAVIFEVNGEEGGFVSNPQGVFVYNNQQHRIPLRYGYFGDGFVDFGSGIEAGVYLFPNIIQSAQGVQVQQNGALFYLSERTVKSQLARLYLYEEENPYFRIAHSEDDPIVAQLKSQAGIQSDIVFFQGVRGPIRIWEIDYPAGIDFNEDYLNTTPPPEITKA